MEISNVNDKERLPRLTLYSILPSCKDYKYIDQFWCAFGGDLNEFALVWNEIYTETMNENKDIQSPISHDTLLSLLALPITNEKKWLETNGHLLYDLIVDFRVRLKLVANKYVSWNLDN